MMLRGKFQVLGLAAILVVFITADAVMAQRGGRGGSPFGQLTQLSLLGQESIQKELELVGDQVEAIKEVQALQRESMRDLFMKAREELQGMSAEERQKAFEGIQKKMVAVNEKLEAEALDSLLPHQTKRLKQIHAQAEVRRNGGPQSGNIPDSLVDELGLTDEQVAELKAKAEEVGKKLKEKVAKLQAQAQNEIFSSVLSPEQQARYEELIGDQFEFEERQRGGFGGFGGDRGGRGGDRGGARGERGGDRGGDRGERGGDRGDDRGSDF